MDHFIDLEGLLGNVAALDNTFLCLNYLNGDGIGKAKNLHKICCTSASMLWQGNEYDRKHLNALAHLIVCEAIFRKCTGCARSIIFQ